MSISYLPDLTTVEQVLDHQKVLFGRGTSHKILKADAVNTKNLCQCWWSLHVNHKYNKEYVWLYGYMVTASQAIHYVSTHFRFLITLDRICEVVKVARTKLQE